MYDIWRFILFSAIVGYMYIVISHRLIKYIANCAFIKVLLSGFEWNAQ